MRSAAAIDGYLPVQSSRAGQQMDIAAIEPGVHAIAVELELVRPLIAARSFRDQPRQLRLDPRGKR